MTKYSRFFQTGPCPVLMTAVKHKLESLSPVDKIATLSLDGMSLRESIRYLEHEDRYVGYEDLGASGRTAEVANQGIVAVIRGINATWKMPIAYYLIRNSVQQERFGIMIKESLEQCQSAGNNSDFIFFLRNNYTMHFTLRRCQNCCSRL